MSPGAAAFCARCTVANGFSNVPQSASFPVGDTKNSAARTGVTPANSSDPISPITKTGFTVLDRRRVVRS